MTFKTPLFVVLRAPLIENFGRVGDQRRRRDLAGVEGQAVYKGFERRSRLPTCLSRSIEVSGTLLVATHQSSDPAGARLDRHQRPLRPDLEIELRRLVLGRHSCDADPHESAFAREARGAELSWVVAFVVEHPHLSRLVAYRDRDRPCLVVSTDHFAEIGPPFTYLSIVRSAFRSFEGAVVLVSLVYSEQPAAQRALCSSLKFGVDRRANDVAAASRLLLTDELAQAGADPREDLRGQIFVWSTWNHAEGRGASTHHLLLCSEPFGQNLIEHPVAARERSLRMTEGCVDRRAPRYPREQCGLIQ